MTTSNKVSSELLKELMALVDQKIDNLLSDHVRQQQEINQLINENKQLP